MKDLFNNTKEFLSILDGAHQLAKGLHWSTDSNSTHLLMDEIDGGVLEAQDKVAECVMGITGQKFQVGDLKALVGNAKEPAGFLKELEKDVLEYKVKVGDAVKLAALHNVLDDLLTDIYKWEYRETQK